jgi:hypothetical protein
MKEIIGAVAVILTFAAYVPYYRDILSGKTRPHIYSWSLWGLLTILLVALQIRGGAGPATWVTVSAGLLCLGVVVLSLRNGKKDITVTDTIVAGLSLMAIGFWLIADQPIISMLLVIAADLLAFIPTVRKSYHHPYAETLSLYVTNTLRFSLALFAVENYTFLSTSWLAAWALGNGLFSLMLFTWRRNRAKSG